MRERGDQLVNSWLVHACGCPRDAHALHCLCGTWQPCLRMDQKDCAAITWHHKVRFGALQSLRCPNLLQTLTHFVLLLPPLCEEPVLEECPKRHGGPSLQATLAATCGSDLPRLSAPSLATCANSFHQVPYGKKDSPSAHWKGPSLTCALRWAVYTPTCTMTCFEPGQAAYYSSMVLGSWWRLFVTSSAPGPATHCMGRTHHGITMDPSW